MDDYALVLNAGSSSLKFCVYQQTAGRSVAAGARGQIEASARRRDFTAKDERGRRSGRREAGRRRCATAARALDALASWLRRHYGGARVLGVGHRVVHGGARFTGPTVVTPRGPGRICAQLVPLAPLHQPHNLAAIDAVAERLPGRAAGRLLRYELPPRPARGRRTGAAAARDPAAGVQRYGFHGLSYEYIASVLPRVPTRSPTAASSSLTSAAAPACARCRSARASTARFGFTALDGLCMGTRPGAVDPGVILYLFQALGLSPKEVETILYKKSGLLGISGISNDMRDLLASRRCRRAPGRGLFRVSRRQGDRRARGVPRVASTRWCSPPALARNPPRSGAASARRRPGWASRSMKRRMHRHELAHHAPAQRCIGVGDPH